MNTLENPKKNKIYYYITNIDKLYRVIEIKKGYKEVGYSDPNANTAVIIDIYSKDIESICTRSIFAGKFKLLENSKKTFFIRKVFEYDYR